jgi:hypothetical protein
MMLRHTPNGRVLIPVVLAAGAMLAACQKGPDAANAQNRPPPAAVARGVVAVEGLLVVPYLQISTLPKPRRLRL